MKRWIVVSLTCVVVAGPWWQVLACGEKFLMPSRGSRFDLAPRLRQQAAVLLYANPSTPMPRTLSALAVDPALTKAGYRPTVVASQSEFDRALCQAPWDVVIVDLKDGPSVTSCPPGARPASVVPIAFNATKTEVNDAKRQYGVVVQSPTRGQSFVDAIDDAIARRTSKKASR